MTHKSSDSVQIPPKLSNTASAQPLSGAKRLRSRRARRGATTLDYLIWFSLAVVVIIGTLTAFQAARDGLRASNLRTQLVRAQSVIENAHSYSGIYAADSLLVFLAEEGFSDRQLARATDGSFTFTSPYDTAITITGDGARDFTIAVAGLPAKGCAAALLGFQDSGAGLDSATVGSTALTVPLTEQAVQTACNNTSNDVSLTF